MPQPSSAPANHGRGISMVLISQLERDTLATVSQEVPSTPPS